MHSLGEMLAVFKRLLVSNKNILKTVTHLRRRKLTGCELYLAELVCYSILPFACVTLWSLHFI